MDRKTFINSSIRILILAILAGFTTLLIRLGKIQAPDSCIENRICDQCGSFNSCNKLQALNRRADEKK